MVVRNGNGTFHRRLYFLDKVIMGGNFTVNCLRRFNTLLQRMIGQNHQKFIAAVTDNIPPVTGYPFK